MIYKTNSGYGVNFNQLAEKLNSTDYVSGSAIVSYSDGVATFTANSQYGYIYFRSITDRFTTGHKYLFSVDIKKTVSGNGNTIINLLQIWTGSAWSITAFNPSDIPLNENTNYSRIVEITGSVGTNVANFRLIQDSNTSGYSTFQLKNFQLFDLTQMFGSGNEPTTVAEFREMYPNDYYDYTLSQWQWAKKGKITAYPTPVIENGTTLLPIEHHIVGLAHYNDGNTDIIYNYAKKTNLLMLASFKEGNRPPMIYDTYLVGIANGNYYNTSNIYSFILDKSTNSITIDALPGYGLGFVLKLKPNKEYRFKCINQESVTGRIMQYDDDWNYLSSKTILLYANQSGSIDTSFIPEYKNCIFLCAAGFYHEWIANNLQLYEVN